MKYALTNGIILNGKEDMVPVSGKSIIIENDKIIDIVDSGKEPSGFKKYDLNGQYVCPGLINLHVHLAGSGMPKDTSKQNKKFVDLIRSNPLTLYAAYLILRKLATVQVNSGVTTLRSVGGVENIDARIRDAVNKGKIKGPRILASNMAVSVPHGHMAGLLGYEATSVEDGIKYVDEIAKTNPNLIKLMITGGVLDAKVKGEPGELKMQPEIVKACCDEAHRLGYQVAAHVESPIGVKVALENGVDTIEHGAKPDEEMIDLFKKTGAVHICTISPAAPLVLVDKNVTGMDDLGVFNGNIIFKGIIECAKECLKNGITVGLGTDSACPFVTQYDMWREVAYFHKYCGVSNAFALHTATEVNASIVGLQNETGTIEVGKSADILVVEKNPLDDLSNLRTPKMVVARGKLIKHPKNKKYQIVEDSLDPILKAE